MCHISKIITPTQILKDKFCFDLLYYYLIGFLSLNSYVFICDWTNEKIYIIFDLLMKVICKELRDSLKLIFKNIQPIIIWHKFDPEVKDLLPVFRQQTVEFFTIILIILFLIFSYKNEVYFDQQPGKYIIFVSIGMQCHVYRLMNDILALFFIKS